VLPSMPAAASRPTVAPSVRVRFTHDRPLLRPVGNISGAAVRRGVKLVATLVVLGGLVAAGVIYGQPYLFPGEWDTATAPYAEAVEAGRGVEFAEPLAIVAEPTDTFGDPTAGQQLAPESAEELDAVALTRPRERHSSTTARVGPPTHRMAGRDLYSTSDGTGVPRPRRRRPRTRRPARARDDRSIARSGIRLVARAAASAHWMQRWPPRPKCCDSQRALQQSSTFDAEVTPVPSELIGPLPPITGYRMLAPHVFVEFDASLPANRTDQSARRAGRLGSRDLR
jgi:hypothetical protein